MKPDDITWNMLMTYTQSRLKGLACQSFWRGLEKLEYSPYHTPDLEKIRDFVFKHTGWVLQRAKGEVPALEFFDMLTRKEFPLVWELRPMNQTFAAAEPDLWHELIGHVPLLFDAQIRDLYCTIAQAAKSTQAEKHSMFIRLYWFFAEYGLIEENGQTKIIGAGLLASPLGANSIKNKHVRMKKMTVDRIRKTKYNPYSFQKDLLVFPSFRALFDIIDRCYQYDFQ